MRRSIEFHDSELSAIESDGGRCALVFRPAYVHQSDGEPGTDAGGGFVQDCRIEIGEARVVRQPHSLPATIADGHAKVCGKVHENVVPMDLMSVDPVIAELTTSENELLVVEGTGVMIVPTSDAEFVEWFPGPAVEGTNGAQPGATDNPGDAQ